MKPAREPASSRPNPCASLKKPHESCPFAAPCGPRRKKNDRGQRSAFSSETSRFALSILAHRGSDLPPGSSTIELPSVFAESGAYVPDRELPGSPRQCSLPLACRHPPEGHQIGARKRRTPENIIPSQPYCRRVSTDRPNRESWLHLSRVNPALHPPERPSHTHTPKPGFGGRGHEIFLGCEECD